jgi:hypothetical protein
MRHKFNPFLLRVMVMSWDGLSAATIAAKFGRQVADIQRLLNSSAAKEIFQALEAQVMDTYHQTQQVIQANMPALIREKIRLATTAGNESVRNRALQDLLEMGGHGAVKRIEHLRADPIDEEFADKSEADIKREIMANIAGHNDNDEPTVH